MGPTTSIQWAHTTVNPVMGCDGCELYPSLAKVRSTIGAVVKANGVDPDSIAGIIDQVTAPGAQYVKLHLESVAQSIASAILPRDANERLLTGIDWMIVGGESGAAAKPFDLSWARRLRDDCNEAGTAFFMKQLGRYPCDDSVSISVADKHGGDWAEWPQDLRVRQVPTAWRTVQSAPCDQHELNLR